MVNFGLRFDNFRKVVKSRSGRIDLTTFEKLSNLEFDLPYARLTQPPPTPP